MRATAEARSDATILALAPIGAALALGRVRSVVPAADLRADELLDQLADVLLPPPWLADLRCVPLALRVERASLVRAHRCASLGLASLFVYWIHVEMVYGVVSTPLHRRLTFERPSWRSRRSALFLFGLVKLKDTREVCRLRPKAVTPA